MDTLAAMAKTMTTAASTASTYRTVLLLLALSVVLLAVVLPNVLLVVVLIRSSFWLALDLIARAYSCLGDQDDAGWHQDGPPVGDKLPQDRPFLHGANRP